MTRARIASSAASSGDRAGERDCVSRLQHSEGRRLDRLWTGAAGP